MHADGSQQPVAPGRSGQRRQPLWEILAAVFLALIAHHAVLYGTFIQDDLAIINAAHLKWAGWDTVTWANLRERPLLYFTLEANYRINGWLGLDPLDPVGFHVFNLSGHLLAVAGLYVLVASLQMRSHRAWRRSERNPEAFAPGWNAVGSSLPLFAAAFFAVHPLTTEPVAYVMARANGWGGALCLWAWALALKALEARPGRSYRPALGLAAVGLFFMSCLFKEVYLVLVLLLPASLWLAVPGPVRASTPRAPIERKDAASPALMPLLFESLFLVGAVAVFFLWPLLGRAIDEHWANPWTASASQSPVVLWNWMRILLPFGVSLEYDHPFREWDDPLSWCSLAGHVLVWVCAWMAGRRRPWVRVAVLLGYLTLAPTNSFLLRYDIWSDRNGYLACAAGLIVLAGFVQELFLRLRMLDPRARFMPAPASYAALSVLVLWLGGLAWLSHSRDRLYRDPEAFWERTADLAPGHPRAHLQLALIREDLGKMKLAREGYEKVLAMCDAPNYFGHEHRSLWRSKSLERLAHYSLQDGDLFGARERLTEAYWDNPDDTDVLRELVKVYLKLDDGEGALDLIKQSHDPDQGSPMEPKDEKELRLEALSVIEKGKQKKAPQEAH